MVTKVNPVFDTTLPRAFVGKSIMFVEVDFVATPAAETDPYDTINFVLQSVGTVATIIGHSAIYDNRMLVMIEGEFPTDTYDGTNSETFAAYLQTVVRAGGATFGDNNFNTTAITVTAPAAGVEAALAAPWQSDQTNT